MTFQTVPLNNLALLKRSNVPIAPPLVAPQTPPRLHISLLSERVSGSYLRSTHADDAVDAATGIVEEGHSDGVLAGRQPVAFGGWVDLEDMSSGAEDGLFPSKRQDGKNRKVQVILRHVKKNKTDFTDWFTNMKIMAEMFLMLGCCLMVI